MTLPPSLSHELEHLDHVWLPVKPRSDNPNTPNISYDVYVYEKSNLAGLFVGSMLYGTPKIFRLTQVQLSVLIVFVLFILGVVVVVAFKCIAALFNPAYRRGEGIKWGLVCYTAVIFSLVTVLTGINLNIRSICYIDNRDFPGAEGMIPPGPFGYQWFIAPSALNVTPNVMFALCNWLADGLLVSFLFDAAFTWSGILSRLLSQLYRCYIIYGKNLWVIAFPCIMYLGSVGTHLNYPRKGRIIQG